MKPQGVLMLLLLEQSYDFLLKPTRVFSKKFGKSWWGNLLLPSIPFAGISYLLTRDSNLKD
jgi:hypothetical protein